MKLLNKTNIYTSVATILLLLVGIVVVYWLILNKIDSEQDEHLLNDKMTVIGLLKEGKPVVLFSANIGEKVSVTEIPAQTIKQNKFRDYTVEEVDGDEGDEDLTYRELMFQTTINNKHYEVKISHSLSEGKEIGEYISTAILIFLAFSLIILFVLNRYISKYIWGPFYNTLSMIKNWTIKDHKPLQLKTTNIDEFTELNTTVNGFVQKIMEDYTNLKEFTENISHETQTPVAIISAKLEMLMQEDDYSYKQQRLLVDTYKATLKLKKLNQTLVALTRIENSQYINIQPVNLSDGIEEKLEELSDFIEARSITVTKSIAQIEKQINPELYNVLLNNLMVNAIKHNLPENGSINIVVNEHNIIFENSGANQMIDKKNTFERFKRYKTNDDSIGLGLSIIKKIIDFLNWDILYSYNNGLHSFTISLKKQP